MLIGIQAMHVCNYCIYATTLSTEPHLPPSKTNPSQPCQSGLKICFWNQHGKKFASPISVDDNKAFDRYSTRLLQANWGPQDGMS